MAANKADPNRVISVQSHVVTGYVGNRSATFPLQLLGWEVDVVNTTQLSNHSGYGRFGGMRLDADHLQSVFDGMERNGLLRYGRMVSGYTPSPSALSVVADFVQRLKTHNPNLIYLMDPVMGEISRGFYVDKGCLPLYQQLSQFASIVTPNQFEAQQLAQQEITSLDSLKEVVTKIHALGVPNVIVTSVVLPDAEVEQIGAKVNGGMILVGSTQDGGQTSSQPWCIQFPELEQYFSGVGDLFSALMLGNFERPQQDEEDVRVASAESEPKAVDTSLSSAAELAVAGVQSVLNKTVEMAKQDPDYALPDNFDSLDSPNKLVERSRRAELRLIQSRKTIENPTVIHRAKWVP